MYQNSNKDQPKQQGLFHLEHFFELSADLFCIVGFDGYFRKINSAVSRTLGYSQEELMSQPSLTFIHPDDLEITRVFRQEITKGTPLLNFENRYLTKTGEVIWLSWTSTPVPDEQLIYAIAKNITHKKKEENDRNTLLAQFSQLNRELKQLTYTTSHDLRSPVNNLLSIFNLMEEKPSDDPDRLRYISILRLATENLKKTLNNYVDLLARKDGLRITRESVNLEACLNHVTQSLHTLLVDAQARVEYHFEEVPEILFNKTYMESVFLNLVSNAIKYASPHRKPVISFHSYQENGWWKISITDNGQGFDVEKVRDRLFRLGEHFHAYPDSKGIGLYLIHAHITGMGGQVEVTSKIDEGTAFVLSFPTQ